MTQAGLIVDMTPDELAQYEPYLRPNGASRSGFYGPSEDIAALAQRDHQTILAAGSSHAEAANKLEDFLGSFSECDPNEQCHCHPSGADASKTVIAYLGSQACPFGCTGPDARGSRHYYFTFQNNKYNCGSLLPHLIRQHGCYEGEQIPKNNYSKIAGKTKVGSDMRVPPEICLLLK